MLEFLRNKKKHGLPPALAPGRGQNPTGRPGRPQHNSIRPVSEKSPAGNKTPAHKRLAKNAVGKKGVGIRNRSRKDVENEKEEKPKPPTRDEIIEDLTIMAKAEEQRRIDDEGFY